MRKSKATPKRAVRRLSKYDKAASWAEIRAAVAECLGLAPAAAIDEKAADLMATRAAARADLVFPGSAVGKGPAVPARQPLTGRKIYFITDCPDHSYADDGFFTTFHRAASFARAKYGETWGDNYDISWKRIIE